MTEVALNDYLKKMRVCIETAYEQRRPDIALLLLEVSSKTAQLVTRSYKLDGKVICRYCHENFTSAIERDYIREYGFCLGCEKQQSESYEQTQQAYDNF